MDILIFCGNNICGKDLAAATTFRSAARPVFIENIVAKLKPKKRRIATMFVMETICSEIKRALDLKFTF